MSASVLAQASYRTVPSEPPSLRRLPRLANCTQALSYNFELTAYGSGTDCYSRSHSAQRFREEVNLIVSE